MYLSFFSPPLFFSKPNSLLEHEIAMLQNLQGAKHQKSPTKPRKPGGRGEGRGEEGEQEEDGGDNYPSDSRVNRESVAQLDEGFIRAFLSGELCLRGVSASRRRFLASDAGPGSF